MEKSVQSTSFSALAFAQKMGSVTRRSCLPVVFVWLLSLALGDGVVFAQTPKPSNTASPSVGSEDLQLKIKAFLAPESGLNNEIRAGLSRIEQACDLSQSKASEAAPLYSKSGQIARDIASTRELIAQQQTQFEKAMVNYRTTHALNVNTCAALPSFLRVSDQCVRYQNDTATAQIVSTTAQSYYAEALARLKSYEAALDLEAKGCTRPDFAYKLWAAEQAHITPKLKTSAERLTGFLN